MSHCSRFVRALASALFVCLLLVSTAQAKDVTFVYETYPPYEFSEGGTLVGTDVDVIREVCTRIGVTPIFREVPWKRAMDEVKTGKADAIFSLFRTEEREGFLAFPEVGLSSERNVLVTRADSGLSVTSIGGLSGTTVGVVVDYAYGEPFDSTQSFTREASNDYEMLMKKLEAGRTDLAVINELVLNSMLRKSGKGSAFSVMEYVVADEPMYVGFSKKSENIDADQMAEEFTNALNAMQAEGVLDEIYNRY